jgi:hypothetical protein
MQDELNLQVMEHTCCCKDKEHNFDTCAANAQ